MWYTKRIYILICFSVTLLILVGCTYSTEDSTSTLSTDTASSLSEIVSIPTTGEFKSFVTSESGDYILHSFTSENFSLEDTKEYIDLLESSGISRIHYSQYNENDSPILIYFGEAKNHISITISQSNLSAIIAIHKKK